MSILVINPGSTSTKLALYEGDNPLISREIQHNKAELAKLGTVMSQFEFRKKLILSMLEEEGVDTAAIECVAGRGGLLHPLEGGTYEVNDTMLDDLRTGRYGEHPCNLGAGLAHDLAQGWGVDAYIVDPVVTDEMTDVARVTGMPGMQRRSLFHALNQRGAARSVARKLGKAYDECNLLVCHMGGGISIGAHRHGRVVDVVNALDGEGPFTPERTGGLPLLPLLDLIESGERTPAELRQIILRQGGVYGLLGTNDPREVLRRVEAGDDEARTVFAALGYTISKHIASLAPALADEAGAVVVDAVVLTGGLARSLRLVADITRQAGFLGPVELVTGDEEMGSLAAGAQRVLDGTEQPRTYVPEPPAPADRS